MCSDQKSEDKRRVTTVTYQTEDEQLAVLGQLWKKYGTKVIGVIAVIAIGFYLYNAWNNHLNTKAREASALYQQLTYLNNTVQPGKTLNKEQMKSFNHVVSQLQKDFPDSTYTQYAYLLQAKQAMDINKPEEAKSALNAVITGSDDKNLKELASIRLSHILIGEGKEGAKEALIMLKKTVNPEAFVVSYQEAMGDAYLAVNETGKAHDAYKKALEAAKKDDTSRSLIQIKLNNISPPEEATK